MPAFRFAAKRVLLTFAQVDDFFTKETILYDLVERLPVHTYTIAEEQHRDGGRHIHALLQFTHRVDTVDVRFFDIASIHHDYHPNIKPVQYGKANWERARAYVVKEDPAPLTNQEPTLGYDEIIAQSSSQEDFLELVLKHHPRDYALNLAALEKVAIRHWPTPSMNTVTSALPLSAQRTPFELYTMDPQAVWADRKSLLVVGPPGIGKTTWALAVAPKPCLFIRHLDSLKRLEKTHKSIVFDDLEFSHLPPATQKFLVDMEQIGEVHVRYAVATIPAGLPRLFTANEYPFLESGVHAEAITRRLKYIKIE